MTPITAGLVASRNATTSSAANDYIAESIVTRSEHRTCGTARTLDLPLLTASRAPYLGAKGDPARARNNQRSVLRLQERSPNLTRPNDEVPQAVAPLDDAHVNASSKDRASSVYSWSSSPGQWRLCLNRHGSPRPGVGGRFGLQSEAGG